MVCAHTPQTERYTHYTPFKRPWIVESKVFFIYRYYPLSSTCYTLYMNPLHMQDNLFWVIGQKVCVTNPNKLENL